MGIKNEEDVNWFSIIKLFMDKKHTHWLNSLITELEFHDLESRKHKETSPRALEV